MNQEFFVLPFSVSQLALPEALWIVFFAAVLIFLFYSMFLVYHWFRYDRNILISLLATIIYGGVSGVIMLVMVISLASLLS